MTKVAAKRCKRNLCHGYVCNFCFGTHFDANGSNDGSNYGDRVDSNICIFRRRSFEIDSGSAKDVCSGVRNHVNVNSVLLAHG